MSFSLLFTELPLEIQNYIYEYNVVHRQLINRMHKEYFSYLHGKKMSVLMKNLTDVIFDRYYCICNNLYCRDEVLIGWAIKYYQYNSGYCYYCSEECMNDDIQTIDEVYSRYLKDVNYSPDY